MKAPFKYLAVLAFGGVLGSVPVYGTAAPRSEITQADQQNRTCRGVVKDSKGETIIGATIKIKGTGQGTVTNINGEFQLKQAKEGDILEVSYIGYTSQSIKWTGKRLEIVLQEDTKALGEIVVTGYGGKQYRTKVTNSISSVKKESLDVGLFSNPAQALSGAVPGLKVIQSSGSPGATPKIVLRGGTNLDGTGSPLVVIDGQLRDSMSDINVDDIASMEILKDAGATALYGARASNGVILITTKKGRSGHSQINFKARMGLNYAYTPFEFLPAGEYIKALRQAVYDAGNLFKNKDGKTIGYGVFSKGALSGSQPYGIGNKYGKSAFSPMLLTNDNKYLLEKGWQTVKDPITGEDIIFKDTNIDSYNINSPSISQDYNLNVSGGNDKGSYFAGIGYNHQRGIPIDTYYKRYSFLINTSYKIKPWLTTSSQFSYNRANWKNMPGSNENEVLYFGRVRALPPTSVFEDEEGNMKLGPNNKDGNQSYQPDKFLRDNQSDKFTMAQSFKLDLMKGLTLNANANWFYSESYLEHFNKDYETKPNVFDRTRKSTVEFSRDFRQTYNAVLNYQTTIKDQHNVDLMLGSEFFDDYDRGFYAKGQGAPTDDLQALDLTDKGEGKRDIKSYHSRRRILSFFGRFNYDYKDRYLLSLVFRRDGYSSLLGSNRWGFFPGISTGWIFTKESFMDGKLPFLSFGKLRASYGINGNASGIKPYELQGSYGSVAYNGNIGYLINKLPNPSLRWEKTATFEIGLDTRLFDNRVTANLTYYDRLTSDKYAQLSFPSSTGFSSIQNNNGKLRNRGIEFELTGLLLETNGFTWNAAFNLAYNKNTIVALPDNGLERNRQDAFQIYTGDGDKKEWVGGYQEGNEPHILYLYKAEGLYRSEKEIPGKLIRKFGSRTYYGPEAWNALTANEQNATTNFPIQPGDVRFKDVNGDGVIDEYDKVRVGNTNPHFTGGFNTTLSWKGLRLYARFDYALGYHIYETDGSNGLPWHLGCMQGSYNVPTLYYDTWSESNPNAKYPRYLWADQLGKSNYYTPSTLFAQRGDYLAFREISLSYTLPKPWAHKLNMQQATFSITGQNLGYLSAAKNIYTPETNADGQVGSRYALPRTLLFGLNLSF